MTPAEHRQRILSDPETGAETINGGIFVPISAIAKEFGITKQNTGARLKLLIPATYRKTVRRDGSRWSSFNMYPLDDAITIMMNPQKAGRKKKPQEPPVKKKTFVRCRKCVHSAPLIGHQVPEESKVQRYCAFSEDTGHTRLGLTTKALHCDSQTAMKKLEDKVDEDCPFFKEGKRKYRQSNSNLFVNRPGKFNFSYDRSGLQEPDGECPGYDFSKL